MMGEAEALRVAIDLLHVPSRVRLIRSEPLPEGVPLLLRIAAGDNEAAQEAVRIADRPVAVVQEAAAFFVEQILLCPEADSYRVLGAGPQATGSELRHNMAMLMKWLHPDSERHGQQTVFVKRVSMAWDDLKTPERRAAYDLDKRAANAGPPVRRRQGRGKGTSSLSAARRHAFLSHRDGLLRRALFFLLGRRQR